MSPGLPLVRPLPRQESLAVCTRAGICQEQARETLCIVRSGNQ